MFTILRNAFGSRFKEQRLIKLVNLIKFNDTNVSLFPANLSNEVNNKCWKCGARNPISLLCTHCNSLQKPNANSSYFDIIGVQKCFDIKSSELTIKFRNLQNLLHPDRFGTKEKEEIAISESYSALVNEAYTTLLNPLERGLYLLKLEGLSIEEGASELDANFLIEIMEKNEELEEANDEKVVLRIAAENKARLENLAREIDGAFKKGNLEAAKCLLSKMKYYWSLEEKIKQAHQRMGIVL